MAEDKYLLPKDNLRADGTKKGSGYYGEISLKDGGITTEFSIGIDGMEIPTLVPTLTREELDYMVETVIPEGGQAEIPKSIINKAIQHASNRMNQGLPVFATQEDNLVSQWKDWE